MATIIVSVILPIFCVFYVFSIPFCLFLFHWKWPQLLFWLSCQYLAIFLCSQYILFAVLLFEIAAIIVLFILLLFCVFCVLSTPFCLFFFHWKWPQLLFWLFYRYFAFSVCFPYILFVVLSSEMATIIVLFILLLLCFFCVFFHTCLFVLLPLEMATVIILVILLLFCIFCVLSTPFRLFFFHWKWPQLLFCLFCCYFAFSVCFHTIPFVLLPLEMAIMIV